MAYSVSDRYKEVIYSGGAVNEAKLIINGTEIPNRQIESIEISDPFFDNTSNTFYLGQFVSKQITIKFKNTDGIPVEGNVELSISTLVDDVWEEVPIGKFLIETNNEDYYKYSKLTCLDYAVKLKTNCDFSSLVQKEDGTITPVTLENLLKWICEQYEIELGTYPTTNKDYLISTYDNSLSGKYYVSLIAELMGSNAHFGRDGKLYIIPIKQSSKATINALRSKTFSKTSSYTISKVVFDDGVRLVEKGTDDNNTLFIRSDNFFVLDNHEELITNIYNSVNGTKIDSLKTENNGDVSLDCFDLVTYTLGDETYTTFYNNKTMYQQVIMNTVETSIPTETQQKTTNVVGDDINPKLRKVYAKINQVEGSIELVSEKVDQISSDVTTSKTIEGNPIRIEDAGEYDIDRLYLEGNSYQETTSGDNLIDWSKPSNTIGTFENEVITITTTGSWKSRTYDILDIVKNNPSKRIYFLCESFEMTSNGIVQINWTQNGTTKYNGLMSYTGSRNSMLIPEDTSEITKATLCIYSNNSSDTGQWTTIIIKPMLYFGEIGNQQEYEPYTNGASPNPDYPQEIEVIKGSVDVEVVGKNLLPISTLSSRTTNGITFTNNNDGTYTLKGTATNLANLLLFDQNNANLKLKSNQYYTLSVKVLSGEVNFSIPSAVKDNEGKITYNYMTLATPTKLTDKEYDFYQISLYIPSGKVVDCTIALQIEESSKATEYEPYKSTTASLDLQDNFLAKIGDVKDELDVVTGKLTKRIGKVVLDGSESWAKGSNYYYWRVADKFPLVSGGSTIPNLISTHFIPKGFDYLYGALVDYGIAFHYSLSQLAIRHKDITTLEDFKNWLSQNNVEIYYELPEPYEVQLDTNLIRLFKGINNISINTNLEPSYVSLTYLVENAWNSQYATKSQLQVTQNNINSVVKDTTTLNANLTDLQALVSVENTNLKNALGDLSNNLEENYATNDAVLTIENSVTNVQTSLNQQIEITKDIQLNGVSKVKTTTGFTFDEDGLTITKTDADTKTNIDEDGMVVYSTTGSEDTEMLVVDSKGVITENVTVRTYLVVGQNSRFQDYETGTGCFWIGSR